MTEANGDVHIQQPEIVIIFIAIAATKCFDVTISIVNINMMISMVLVQICIAAAISCMWRLHVTALEISGKILHCFSCIKMHRLACNSLPISIVQFSCVARSRYLSMR